MYLRGVQYSEMESIMQFIYIGEATFYEERMDEFLAVAKSLEIKELCKVWYPNLVLELFSRIKSSSLEIFQLEKLQNIEGMILERNGVDFRNEDDQIS